jgi:hypothetical protein
VNIELFETYELQLAAGLRKAATESLARFIQSFSGLDEKRQWSRAFLSRWQGTHKIRHELYQHVIFPVLLESYQSAEAWGIDWLARTTQNLYQAKQLWDQIDNKSEVQLLNQLRTVTPHDEDVKRRLLARQIDWLRYCVHEWPSGILYGTDGATLPECAEIKEAVAEARELDVDGNYNDFLAEFDSRLNVYVMRLQSRQRERASSRSS